MVWSVHTAANGEVMAAVTGFLITCVNREGHGGLCMEGRLLNLDYTSVSRRCATISDLSTNVSIRTIFGTTP